MQQFQRQSSFRRSEQQQFHLSDVLSSRNFGQSTAANSAKHASWLPAKFAGENRLFPAQEGIHALGRGQHPSANLDWAEPFLSLSSQDRRRRRRRLRLLDARRVVSFGGQFASRNPALAKADAPPSPSLRPARSRRRERSSLEFRRGLRRRRRRRLEEDGSAITRRSGGRFVSTYGGNETFPSPSVSQSLQTTLPRPQWMRDRSSFVRYRKG